MTSFSFDTEDGLHLHVHAWRPAAPAKAVVHIAHGMAEHGARYARLGEALAGAGYAAYAHDHRGHGLSLQNGTQPGHMADSRSFDRAVHDIVRLGAHLMAEHPGAKRVVFGHSMGSFYIQRLLYQRPEGIDAAILSSTNGRPPPIATAGRGVARIERLRVGKRGQSSILTALSFGDFNKSFTPSRTDFDWLSRDEAEVDKYIADPLCGFAVSTQTWVDLLDALPELTEPENVGLIPRDLPIYVFSGTRDAVGGMGVGVRSLVKSYRDAGLSRVELRLYEGGRHEMLHETNRDEVIADLLAWLAQTLR
jgi:alpha-beta hydrolase superfamily lysophospholipase